MGARASIGRRPPDGGFSRESIAAPRLPPRSTEYPCVPKGLHARAARDPRPPDPRTRPRARRPPELHPLGRAALGGLRSGSRRGRRAARGSLLPPARRSLGGQLVALQAE